MSTYKVIELVGSSYTSWADAAKTALGTAGKTLRDLRVAEVTRMDVRIEDDGQIVFRTRLKVSFKVQTLEKFVESLGAKPYAQEEE
ncbi:MAG: dodecin domain-containing protein [Deltaproteobacteria bacterium]|jgi:flavin-binding protein dodecin|nr:dodecin domain-containing protein [Deltaproteobacteria bacterium]MBW2443427.1 dodecin domain-containing protein [Deltaproteobacteria bacterium]